MNAVKQGDSVYATVFDRGKMSIKIKRPLLVMSMTIGVTIVIRNSKIY